MTAPALERVAIEKPAELNVILGQAHFIKTVEDVHEAIVGTSGALRFGLAFCESSGPSLVRRSGNDGELVELATRTALAIGAGHSFVVFLREGFPVTRMSRRAGSSCAISATSSDRRPGCYRSVGTSRRRA
jgi:adenosine/AMP kinase